MVNIMLLISGVQCLILGQIATSDLVGLIYSGLGGMALGWYNMRVNDEHQD